MPSPIRDYKYDDKPIDFISRYLPDDLQHIASVQEVEVMRGYTFRLLLTKSEEDKRICEFLNQNLGCRRFVWNFYVNRMYKFLEKSGYSGGRIPNEFWKDLPTTAEMKRMEGMQFLSGVSSHTTQGAFLDFKKAVEKYNKEYVLKKGNQLRKSAKRKIKNGEETGIPYKPTFHDFQGLPRFCAKYFSKESFRLPDDHGSIKVKICEDDKRFARLSFQTLKSLTGSDGIKFKLRKTGFNLEKDVYAVTIRRVEQNKYDVTLHVKMSVKINTLRSEEEVYRTFSKFLLENVGFQRRFCLGLDYAQKEGCVASREEENAYLEESHAFAKHYRRAEERLSVYNKIISRKYESLRKENDGKLPEMKEEDKPKALRDIQKKQRRLHRYVKNIRKNGLDMLSFHFAEAYALVAVEDIDLRGLSQSLHLAKNLLDNGFGMFRKMLEYKLEERGLLFVKIPKFFASSQICHSCGYKNPIVKDTAIREWTCPSCGEYHDRVICLIIIIEMI